MNTTAKGITAAALLIVPVDLRPLVSEPLPVTAPPSSRLRRQPALRLAAPGRRVPIPRRASPALPASRGDRVGARLLVAGCVAEMLFAATYGVLEVVTGEPEASFVFFSLGLLLTTVGGFLRGSTSGARESTWRAAAWMAAAVLGFLAIAVGSDPFHDIFLVTGYAAWSAVGQGAARSRVTEHETFRCRRGERRVGEASRCMAPLLQRKVTTEGAAIMSVATRTAPGRPPAWLGPSGPRTAAPAALGTARTTGLLYLALALTGLVGFLILRPQVFTDDAVATVTELVEHESVARLVVALELGAVLAQALVAVWFYRLFRSVDSVAAGALAAFGLVNATAILVSAASLATALGLALNQVGDADGASTSSSA